MSDPIIQARAVEKFYTQPDGNRIQVIAPIDLSIETGKIIALLGPSGCGKSTLLRILSGLSKPSSGEILWHGKPLAGQTPHVSIVFQSFALFPWLTVLENVEAPLEALGVGAVERHKRALKTLDTVGLDGFETAYPKELSGGMKQRVGFARALVVEPEVLFMDEPFSALDVLTAENLRNELTELWLSKKMPTSAIFLVTHNIEEAILLADRVIVLGRNPARIRSDFEVRLARFRDRKDPRFVELVDYIYQVMTQPEVEHVLPGTQAAPEPGGRKKYQMLPHARVGRHRRAYGIAPRPWRPRRPVCALGELCHGRRRSAADHRGQRSARLRHAQGRRGRDYSHRESPSPMPTSRLARISSVRPL